jgi:hypothetical protein
MSHWFLFGTGKAGRRIETRKSGHQRGYARRALHAQGHFSDKEKDEARPLDLFFSGLLTNAFILGFAGV